MGTIALEALEAGLEEAEVFRLVGHAEPTDLGAAVVHGFDGFGDDVAVGLGIDASRERQPNEFQLGDVMLAGLGVASGGDDPALHGADAGFEIEFGGQGLGGELDLRDVGQEPAGVEKDGMAADGLYDRDADRKQSLANVLDLADAGPYMVFLYRFVDPARHRFEIASGQAAIGMQPFIDHDQVPGFFKNIFIVQCQEAADIYEQIFFAAHGAGIGIRAHFVKDLGYGVRSESGFPLPDEPRVFDRSRGIEDDANVMFFRERSQLPEILHRDRLPSGHIDRGSRRNVRNPIGPNAFDQRFEFMKIDIALEGVQAFRIVGFVHDHIDERAAREFLVQARGREIHVARNEIAGLDQDAREQVLGAASLVGRYQIPIAIILANFFFQMIKVLAPRIGFVPHHQAGPLVIAHGIRSAVGEQIDINVARSQEKGIISGFQKRVFAIRARGHMQRLDHLDLKGLGPGAFF